MEYIPLTHCGADRKYNEKIQAVKYQFTVERETHKHTTTGRNQEENHWAAYVYYLRVPESENLFY